jgi:hypothetical protein
MEVPRRLVDHRCSGRESEATMAGDRVRTFAVLGRPQEGRSSLPIICAGRKRTDLVGGGLIRSLGGWSEVRTLKGGKEKVDHDARILGGSDFVSHILREADKRLRRQLRTGARGQTTDALIRSVCAEEGIDEKELRAGGQRRKVSEARARLCYQLSRELGVSMAEIGRHVGVCTSAVFKAIRTFDQKRDK